MTADRWLPVDEIAEMLEVHVETVRRWLRSGELEGVNLEGKSGYRVRESTVEAFLLSKSYRGPLKAREVQTWMDHLIGIIGNLAPDLQAELKDWEHRYADGRWTRTSDWPGFKRLGLPDHPTGPNSKRAQSENSRSWACGRAHSTQPAKPSRGEGTAVPGLPDHPNRAKLEKGTERELKILGLWKGSLDATREAFPRRGDGSPDRHQLMAIVDAEMERNPKYAKEYQ